MADEDVSTEDMNQRTKIATISVFVVIFSALQAIGIFTLMLLRNYSPLEITPYRMGIVPGELFNNLSSSPSAMWELAFWLVTIWNCVSLLSAKIGDSAVWNWAAIVINLVLIVGNLVVSIVSLAVHGFNANLEPGVGGHIFNPANDPHWCCATPMWSNPASGCPWSVACTGIPGYWVSIGARELKVYLPYILRLGVIALHSVLQIILVILAYSATPKPPTRRELKSFFKTFSIDSNINNKKKRRKRRNKNVRRRLRNHPQGQRAWQSPAQQFSAKWQESIGSRENDVPAARTVF